MSATAQLLRRPVFAIVLSIFILLTGVLAAKSLPVSQYPQIAPPRVMVSLAFPGASADVLIQSSLIILERAINGVPDMSYMLSDATSAGEAVIQVIFELGSDENAAVVNVKNRVDQVMSRLPELVQLEGVVVTKVQPSMLMYINLFSLEKTADQKFLYNFANADLLPELSRVRGIAQTRILGSRQYAMRVWLNPDKMRAYTVSTEEVMDAIDEQSIIARPGRLGQASGKQSEALEYVLTFAPRYNKPEQYENIIIRAKDNGEMLRLKDVATIELGSEFFDIYSNLDGHPSAAIMLKQSYGSDARAVIADVKATMDRLKKEAFPAGMDYQISYDVSSFLDASIEKVLHTLLEAFVLVAFVVFIFLGDWRSTLIPTLAVPVSLVGAFACMSMLGITINLITLFALVLAIGIVVDNAIVVVEAVHAKMAEKNSTPYHAVREVLGEISGAIIAITLMMTAVFIPVSFMSGPVGIFYRQFSITMAASIVLSGIVALTLTPVLCAILLKNQHGHASRTPLGKALAAFNRMFERFTDAYAGILRRMVPRKALTFAILALSALGIYGINKVLPSGFIPNEDQAMIYAIVQTPPGSTLESTNDVARQLQQIVEKVDGIESVSALAGYEILTEGRGSNAGTCLITAKPWSERTRTVTDIIQELEEKSKDLGAVVEFFEPPAVPGYGAASGFALRLLDKNNETDYQEFAKVNQDFMDNLHKRPELSGLFTFFAANYPQYELIVQNDLAMQKGVSIKRAMDNLSILIGSTYEQGFIRFSNYFKVYTQAAPEFRRFPTDLTSLYVKNEEGDMVPYSTFMTMRKTEGPNEITRYNMYTSSAIRGQPAKGYTSGDAIAAVKEVASTTLPRGYDIAWEGLSFDEAKRGNEAVSIFGIVLVFVYLVLAAQYESFVIPFAVILSLPPGALGSFVLLKLFGVSNDIYAQVGLVMLVGLLGKNAVLIVEFAVQKKKHGATVLEAAIQGGKERFRPILMTSFAFMAGLVPLVIATGPGAVANRTIGASALGGMLFGTAFGVLLVPGLYFIFGTLAGAPLIRYDDDEPLTKDAAHHA
jgi:HAE1 family hydrophobic/amphiphilic exporter-1